MQQNRETIWGIHPKDRRWFQLITLAGGIAGSVILTLLELDSLSGGTATPSQAARNIVVGIGGSFAASGFIAWGVIQVKEMPMAIADWIREATERRRQKLRQESYNLGYDDREAGKPRRYPESTADKPREQQDDETGRSE